MKEEDESSSRTDLNSWSLKEDSLADREDPDQKCSSSVLSWCREDSPDSRGTFTEEGRLKEEEEDESDCEPCFRVGESCYKGVSPALNTHRSPKKDVNHMTSEDQSPCGAPQESPRLWTEPIRPGITRLRQDDAQKKKRQKKKERKLGVKKARTSKLSLKKRTAKSSLQRAATAMKRKDKRKRRRLGD